MRFTEIEIRLDDYHFETRLLSTDPAVIKSVIENVKAQHPGYRDSFVGVKTTSELNKRAEAVADQWLAVAPWFRYFCYGVAIALVLAYALGL